MRHNRIYPFIFGAAIIAAILFILHILFPGALSQDGYRLELVSLILALCYLLLGVGSQRWKKKQVMQAMLGWSGVAIVLLLGYSFRHDLTSLWVRIRGDLFPTYARAIDGNTVEISKTKNEHFEVKASVNGVPILFLIDTGATNVTLSQADAKSIGIDVDRLTYNISTNTANGRGWAAGITLDLIEIGPIELKDVKAHVVKSGLAGSLLGMSFLSRLKSYMVSQDKMILIK